MNLFFLSLFHIWNSISFFQVFEEERPKSCYTGSQNVDREIISILIIKTIIEVRTGLFF